MQTRIKFTSNGCCSALGNFGPGDVARVPQALADHLVNEARCAVYDEAPRPSAAPPAAPARAPRRRAAAPKAEA